MPLIEREDSLLVVIDLQPGFWGDRLDADDLRRAREVAARAAWLAGVASALGVPAVITEEEPQQNGPTDAAVLAALRPRAPIFTKPTFGLADCPDILEAIASTGRHTAVLAGYETDVCVTHSAVGLREAGYPGRGCGRRGVLAIWGSGTGHSAPARFGGRAGARQGHLLRLGAHFEGRARLP